MHYLFLICIRYWFVCLVTHHTNICWLYIFSTYWKDISTALNICGSYILSLYLKAVSNALNTVFCIKYVSIAQKNYFSWQLKKYSLDARFSYHWFFFLPALLEITLSQMICLKIVNSQYCLLRPVCVSMYKSRSVANVPYLLFLISEFV